MLMGNVRGWLVQHKACIGDTDIHAVHDQVFRFEGFMVKGGLMVIEALTFTLGPNIVQVMSKGTAAQILGARITGMQLEGGLTRLGRGTAMREGCMRLGAVEVSWAALAVNPSIHMPKLMTETRVTSWPLPMWCQGKLTEEESPIVTPSLA